MNKQDIKDIFCPICIYREGCTYDGVCNATIKLEALPQTITREQIIAILKVHDCDIDIENGVTDYLHDVIPIPQIQTTADKVRELQAICDILFKDLCSLLPRDEEYKKAQSLLKQIESEVAE